MVKEKHMAFKVIKENILKLNDDTACVIRESMKKSKTLMINIISSPGAGKTTLIEKIPHMLKDAGIRFAVLTGDCFTTNDAARIDKAGAEVIQINTGNSCHIDAQFIRSAISEINLDGLDLLIVENVGNLVCPAEFDIGEDCKIVILSLPEGDDKPKKYPLVFTESELVMLNKVDLLGHLPFNIDKCIKNIQGVNSKVPIIKISSLTGDGLDEFIGWLTSRINIKKGR